MIDIAFPLKDTSLINEVSYIVPFRYNKASNQAKSHAFSRKRRCKIVCPEPTCHPSHKLNPLQPGENNKHGCWKFCWENDRSSMAWHIMATSGICFWAKGCFKHLVLPFRKNSSIAESIPTSQSRKKKKMTNVKWHSRHLQIKQLYKSKKDFHRFKLSVLSEWLASAVVWSWWSNSLAAMSSRPVPPSGKKRQRYVNIHRHIYTKNIYNT